MSSNKSANIATAFVAIIAVAIAVVAISKYAGASQEETDLDEDLNSVFIPSDAVSEEMKDAAMQLIEQNFSVVKLFYTKGLPSKEEPYGHTPESGYYAVDFDAVDFDAVDSDKYTNVSQINALVDETYYEEEAERIKSDPLGFGAPLYIEREDGQLGIHMLFEIDYDYSVDWSSPSYVVIPASNTECLLRITIIVDGVEETEDVNMSKLNGRWYMSRVVK